jgi:hypothetical protein
MKLGTGRRKETKGTASLVAKKLVRVGRGFIPGINVVIFVAFRP